MKFFTSDTHYYHSNIIRYSNRPYKSVDEMNKAMIDNWNSVVKPGDEVYHLGDFGFASEAQLDEILNNLNGRIHFIVGNHDKTITNSTRLKSCFASISGYKEVYIENSKEKSGRSLVVLCHYPMIEWNKSHHGSFMLHGHCHGNLTYPFKNPRRIMDVGVDPVGYFPIDQNKVVDILSKLEIGTHHENKME